MRLFPLKITLRDTGVSPVTLQEITCFGYREGGFIELFYFHQVFSMFHKAEHGVIYCLSGIFRTKKITKMFHCQLQLASLTQRQQS